MHRTGWISRAAAQAVVSRAVLRVVLGGVALGLAACGGGGGDAGTPVGPVEPLAISAGNYEAVSRQSTLAAGYLLDTGSLVGGAQLAPDAGTLIRFSRGLVARLPGLLRGAPQLVSGVTTTEQLACSGGGFITATGNDVNGNGEVDNGDSARLVANGCVELGATITGTMEFGFSAISGDLLGDVYSATVAVTLTNLRAVTTAGNISGSGTLTLSLTGTGVDRVTVAMQVPLLTMSGTVGGINDALTLRDWRLTSQSVPGAEGPTVSVTLSGTTVSSALENKSVTVSTVTPLVVLAGDTYPSSGRFVTTGAAGSQVRVTALNAGTARLELDADGNGQFETSVDRAWTTLN